MKRTVTGAVRAIDLCRSSEELATVWAEIGTIAWQGPTVRAAYEAKRDALIESECARDPVPGEGPDECTCDAECPYLCPSCERKAEEQPHGF